MWCRHCQLLFWSFDSLKHHMMNDHLVSKIFKHNYRNIEKKVAVFKCFQCLKKFACSKDLNRHIDSIHYEEYYDCEYCDEKFTRKDNYLRHKRTSHMDLYPKYCCKECGKKFSRKATFERHMENICNKDGSAKFVCDQCKERFCTSLMLITHCESKHSESQGKFRCYRCSINFETSLAREAHNKQVHFSEAYKCEKCDKTFARKDNLLRHQLNQKAKKNLVC